MPYFAFSKLRISQRCQMFYFLVLFKCLRQVKLLTYFEIVDIIKNVF